jgi:hypothetical protein
VPPDTYIYESVDVIIVTPTGKVSFIFFSGEHYHPGGGINVEYIPVRIDL